MAGQLFFSTCLWCVILLGVLVMVHSVSVRLQFEGRQKNILMFRCVVSEQIVGEERIDFELNSRSVEDISELTISRGGVQNINITINYTTEGFFTCSLLVAQDIITTSDRIGPFAADPRYTVKPSVPLFYVGFVGSAVTLQSEVPLGFRPDLYMYTWRNGTSHDLTTLMEEFSVNSNKSLSITSLKPSHNGSYALMVQVTAYPDTETPFTYTNNNYRLQVQETPHFNDAMASSIEVFVEDNPQQSEFRCSVQGYPNVSIQWYHNDLLIRSSNRKYQKVDDVSGPPYTANSTLIISNLNATDNGVVSCAAKTNGCDVSLSRESCHSATFLEFLNTSLSVFTKDFEYSVTILSGRNMELIIRVNGKPIPTAVRVHLLYLDAESERERLYNPDSSHANADRIHIFIPNSETPEFTRFKIKVALGTDRDVGPYVSQNTVYDINDPDETSDKQHIYQALAIALPCVAGVIIVVSIIAVTVFMMYRRNNTKQYKEDATEVAMEMTTTTEKTDPIEKAKEFQDVFKIIYRIMADSDDSDASESVTTSVEVKTVADLGTPRIVADLAEECQSQKGAEENKSPFAHPRVSKEWIEETQEIFGSTNATIEKKVDILCRLSTFMREENLLPLQETTV